MEFLRAGANVMQTFTFSASEDNMESKVNSASWLGDRVEGGWAGTMYNKNNLLMGSCGIDLMCYYTSVQTPHKIFMKLLIM